jgi:hypothetical protein
VRVAVLVKRPERQPAGLQGSEAGFELVQFSCPLGEPGVGGPFADAGQDPADGFCPAGRGAGGDQDVQYLQVRGAEPDVSRGEVLLAAGWIVCRGTEPVPDLALAAVLAASEGVLA